MNSQLRQYFDSLSISPADLNAEATGESTAICDCCGRETRTVWGYLHFNTAGTIAAYFMQWTTGASLATHPANFDLIIGPWGAEDAARWRCLVSLIQFAQENEAGETVPGVMVVDADTRPAARGSLAGTITRREDVIATPFAQSVFALFDAALLQDGRLSQFLRPPAG